jgi:hypothetical protein
MAGGAQRWSRGAFWSVIPKQGHELPVNSMTVRRAPIDLTHAQVKS